MSTVTGITADEVRDETLTDLQISPSADIQEAKLLYDLSTGHNHNGINSRLLSGGGSNDTVFQDDGFTGTVNGINDTFTMAYPFITNSTTVYVAGIRQKRGVHYTESAPDQIVLSVAPPTGSNPIFDYIKA